MAGILKISEATAIGMHAMLLMATRPEEMLTTKDVSETLGVSLAHLSKVLQRLSHVGLVTSTRGPKGGSTLARGAETITLLDIYEALEGPLKPVECLLSVPVCQGHCGLLGNMLSDVNNLVKGHLTNTTLADAAKKIL